MKQVYHSANTRGVTNIGWLNSRHTFSFSDYYCPERIQFGTLRVLNDDVVSGGMGFGLHSHQDMEIISIPLQGALAHKDSADNSKIINVDDVQVMSAGTGIMHSEFNASESEDVNFLQIWIIPDKKGVSPRYDQKKFEELGNSNQIQLLVAPFGTDNNALKIHQQAYVSRVSIASGHKFSYQKHEEKNSVYIFVMVGQILVNDQILTGRDGFGMYGESEFELNGLEKSSILILEVPFV